MRLRGAEISGLYGRTAGLFGVEIQAVDALCLLAVVLFDLLILLFHGRIPNPWPLLFKTTLLGAAYFAATAVYRRVKLVPVRWLIRTASIQLMLAQLFIVSMPMQLILVRKWQDPGLLRFEKGLLGVQPTIWLERFVTPPLTEWMMFAYVFYLVIYPGLSALIFVRRGEPAMEDYLFNLAAVNLSCFLFFFIYPIAGPLYHMPEAYSVPLRGGFFAAIGEYIRANIHEIGGNLPSPHCAVATIMWAFAFRYVRPAFYALAPVIISLYVSTFFLRFHYLTDSVAGILTGAFVILAAPGAMRAWNAAIERRERKTP
jgi:membrane-associated phospholipid phosphatase